jgi:predicted site-specific integrase-resolvase
MTNEKLYSADELADLFGVTASTLARWRRTGEPNLPYLRLGNRVRYRACDIERFLDRIGGDAEEGDVEDNDD